MRLETLITILFAVGLLACSTTKETSVRKARYSRDRISSEEIQNIYASNAYDLIGKLRPHWLRGRGTKSMRFQDVSYPVVYVDESRHGSINSLSNISVDHIKEVRFLNSSDATFKFGLNHPGGAIIISI